MSNKNNNRRNKQSLPPFIQEAIDKGIPDPTPEEIDAMEAEIRELEEVDDVLRRAATGFVADLI